MKLLKIAILASGNGSNAENIIRFCQENPHLYQLPIVLCDNPEAYVIKRCEMLGTKVVLIPVEKKSTLAESREFQEKKMLEILSEYQISLICLAGYMRILSSTFIDCFYDVKIHAARIINVHPSLLPSFKGTTAYIEAFNYGVKMSGVTLHLVDKGMDSGPILMQDSFMRFDVDTFDEFILRGLAVEHRLYRQVLQNFATLEIRPILLPGGRKLITFSSEDSYVTLV